MSVLPTTTHAVVWPNIPTLDPVVFIRIDDGYPGNDSEDAAQLVESGLVVNPILTYYAASSGAYPPSTDPVKVAHVEYLRRFTGGRGVGCHAKTHLDLRTLSYADQYANINTAANWLARADMFGTRPVVLGTPYGYFNTDTLKAAVDAGFAKVLPKWTHTRTEIGVKPLRAGDIILLHFDANLYADLLNAQTAVTEAGLSPARFEDYIQ